MKYASTKNDINYLIECMQSSLKIVNWDKGRKRIPYLKGELNVKEF